MDAEIKLLFDKAENLVNVPSPFSEQEKGEQRKLIAGWRAKYGAPCRLAIVGKAKGGKSTLVNALLEHNWSAVGCTETTGTICVMTNRVAPHVAKPVLCVKSDGSSDRWMSLAEANVMQGHDRKHLERTKDIRWLEYALGLQSAPFLADFELVDTPGTDAIVGADGTSHDKVSLSFVQEVDALVLVTQNTLGSDNKKILEAFHSNKPVNDNNPGADVFIIHSQVDAGGCTVEEMRVRKKSKSRDLLKEAVTNYGFAGSTRVLCVSALLENVMLQVGPAGMCELYNRLRSSCKGLEDISDKLQDWIISIVGNNAPIDVILDAIFISESALEAYETLRELAGIQELRRYLVEEMRAKKKVFRQGRILKELMGYYQFDFKQIIANYTIDLKKEQQAYARLCRMVEGEPDFQRGKLGQGLKSFIAGFKQQGLEEVEGLRAELVVLLQKGFRNVLAYWEKEEVYSYYKTNPNQFTAEESQHIEELCCSNGAMATLKLADLQHRRNHWMGLARRTIDANKRGIITKVINLYGIHITTVGRIMG